MRPTNKIILLVLLLLKLVSGMSQDKLVLEDKGEIVWGYTSGLKVLIDSNENYAFEDVCGKEYDKLFVPYEQVQFIVLNPGLRYYTKQTLKNSTQRQSWILEYIDPHLSELTVNIYHKDSLVFSGIQGADINNSVMNIKHKNYAWEIQLLPGEEHTIYTKLSSRYHGVIQYVIKPVTEFVNYAMVEYYLLGFFYGTLVIIALYHLLLFFQLREWFFLHYVFYILTAILVGFSNDGIAAHILWSDKPLFNRFLFNYSTIIFIFALITYTRSFIKVKHFFPVYNRWLNVALVLALVYYLLEIYVIDLRLQYVINTLIFVMTAILSFKTFKKGYRPARYFIVGHTCVILSLLINIMLIFGLVPANYFTVYAFYFALYIEILVLSIAVGDRIRWEKEERLKAQDTALKKLKEAEETKDKLNRELEKKVEERTVELREANQKLAIQAAEITEMNLKLDSSNRHLRKKVEEVSKKRIHGEELDPEEFRKIYPDKLSCYKFLEEIKWHSGYHCKKCSNTTYSPGTGLRSRRCTKCGVNETVTSNTIFHRLRMPIESAFYMLAMVVQSKGKVSSSALAEKTGINQKSCWAFRQKIIDRMNQLKGKNDSWVSVILDSVF